jgi:S1-C subfamily serine protease
VNLLDLGAVAILVAAVALGAGAGFFPQLFGMSGAVAGFGLAILAASAFQPYLVTIEQPLRAVLALAGLITLILLGESTGTILGARVRASMRDRFLSTVDLAGGALIGLAQGIGVLWIAGGLLSAGAIPQMQPAARQSVILRAVDSTLPEPEGVAADLVGLLAPTDLPDLFAGLEPPPAPPLNLPSSSRARTLAASAVQSTVRVMGFGCGREQLGSGFFVADHGVVTNAHVVAGVDSVSIDAGGRTFSASIVLYDPKQDVAVLRVPGTSRPALRLADQTPQRGTDAVALGYPGGGPLALVPAVVTQAFDAAGPDIYEQGSTSRQIVELRADVRRGDSGGPLIVAPGVAGGIVFGASRTNAAVGYAIAANSVADKIHRAADDVRTVSSGACLP